MSALLQAALAAHAAGRPDQALGHLRALGPAAADDALALQLWSVLCPPADVAASLALLERAARLAPGDPQANFNLGVVLQAQGDLARAVLHYQTALAAAPDHRGALNNLSDLLRRRGRAEEGYHLLRRYSEAGGDLAGLEIRAAKLALDTRRFDEAQAAFAAAQAREPASALVAFEHAMLLLAREDWAKGWAGYERRLDVHGLAGLGIYPHAAPPWRGEPLAGKRLLLHREQGLGDMIMFAAALPDLIAEAGEVHLALHPQLVRLFAESFPRARVWSSVTHLGAAVQPDQPYLRAAAPFDVQAPVGSLGALRLGSGPPAPAAYLRAPADDVAAWAERLTTLAPITAGARRIGLVLAARRPHGSDDGLTNGVRKSVPAALAGALAEVAGVRWVALHDRESAALLADVPDLAFADASPWITDLADTAALIANLDAVVTVDTAVAHLAGAMGKPVFLLLWRNADWRWGLAREQAAWYPRVTLIRQTVAGDWRGPLEAICRRLVL